MKVPLFVVLGVNVTINLVKTIVSLFLYNWNKVILLFKLWKSNTHFQTLGRRSSYCLINKCLFTFVF